MERYEFGIIGGGIVGLSTAMALTERGCCSLVVVEAEHAVARHQSGRNSSGGGSISLSDRSEMLAYAGS